MFNTTRDSVCLQTGRSSIGPRRQCLKTHGNSPLSTNTSRTFYLPTHGLVLSPTFGSDIRPQPRFESPLNFFTASILLLYFVNDQYTKEVNFYE